MASGRLVIPGDVVFNSSPTCRPGIGTYELHGRVYASLAGYVHRREEINQDGKKIEIIEIRRSDEQGEHVVPYIGGIVTARVLNIGARYARCELLGVENTPLVSEFSAILRKENINSIERDKDNVVPGDVLVARVISFGDSTSSYLISIAENELGVIAGVGEKGERLLPIDWCTVRGVKSGRKFRRKVAQIPSILV